MKNATQIYMERTGLDRIADVLSRPGQSWSSATLDDVRSIIEATGRYVPDNADTGEIYLRRSSELLLEELPEDCIRECSASGDVTAAVEHWCKALPFGVEPEAARRYLASTGGWDPGELEAADPDTLAQRVLWIACCDFGEYLEDPDGACGTNVFILGG